MPAPLTGIRVLDFSRLLPGAFATLMLAELGAEVIKVEDPNEPDQSRESGADFGENLPADNERARRYVAKYTVKPAGRSASSQPENRKRESNGAAAFCLTIRLPCLSNSRASAASPKVPVT